MATTGQQGRTARGAEAEPDMDSLRSDLAALRAELAGVVAAVKSLGDSAVATAKRQQGAAIDRLTEEVETLAADTAGAARDQLAELETRIRAQPLAAVGIAFAVGLLFGSLRR